jgi:hypothetical protein
MTFDDLRANFGARGCFPADQKRPSYAYFRRLTKRFGRTYSNVFMAFQVVESLTVPMAARDWDGFGWAAPGA